MNHKDRKYLTLMRLQSNMKSPLSQFQLRQRTCNSHNQSNQWELLLQLQINQDHILHKINQLDHPLLELSKVDHQVLTLAINHPWEILLLQLEFSLWEISLQWWLRLFIKRFLKWHLQVFNLKWVHQDQEHLCQHQEAVQWLEILLKSEVHNQLEASTNG